MSNGFSMANALVLTNGDFKVCIEAFNKITPDAELVINDLNENQIYVANLKKIPILNFAVDKVVIDKASSDRQLLTSVLGRVLDEVYYV